MIEMAIKSQTLTPVQVCPKKGKGGTPLDTEQKTTDEVASYAYNAVWDTMEPTRHTPDSWTREGLEHHLIHAVEHIADYQAGDRSEPHLEHALCRLAMAIWSAENGVLGNNGPEGINQPPPSQTELNK